MSAVDELICLATECLKTDYSNPKAVLRHNINAKKMGRLIAKVDKDTDLLLLLGMKATRGWVAYQLLKKPDELSGPLKTKAIHVLKELEKASGPESVAASLRLQGLETKG
jgi:hypothetical protein